MSIVQDIMKKAINRYKAEGGNMSALYEKIGVSQAALSRYLNGTLPMNNKFIKNFSDALQMPEILLLPLVRSQVEISVLYTLSGTKVNEVIAVTVLDLSVEDIFGVKVDKECAELRTGTIIIASREITPAEHDSVVLIRGDKAHYGVLEYADKWVVKEKSTTGKFNYLTVTSRDGLYYVVGVNYPRNLAARQFIR